MNRISFGNNSANIQTVSPEMQKRIDSGENFGAIDKQKLAQDTVQIAQTTVKENFIFRILRNTFGVKDPKKFLISAGATLAATVGLAFIGNKSVKFMADLGLKFDNKFIQTDFFKKTNTMLNGAKKKIGGFFSKSKTIQDLSHTLKTKKAKPVQDFGKGYGQGFVPQFVSTVIDSTQASSFKAQEDVISTLKKITGSKENAIKLIVTAAKEKDVNKLMATYGFDKITDPNQLKAVRELMEKVVNNNNSFRGSLEKLVGKDGLSKEKNFDYFYDIFMGIKNPSDRTAFADDLTEAIVKARRGVTKQTNPDDYQDILKEVLFELKDKGLGEADDYFTKITMNREGFLGSWWPVNIIDSVNKKIMGKNYKPFGKGNLGDALLKYNISNGKLAKTGFGSFIQNSVLIPSESISNFVCDSAGFNLFLIPSIFALFNSAQEAPKGQKVATVADDFVGTIGTMTISTPLSFALTYGLASMKNLEGKSAISKYLLKPIGKFFGMGLDAAKHKTWKNFPVRFAGGALRLVMMMFVFNSILSKPINAVVHKIFGKPYDKEAAEQAKQLEAQKNQIIPELGITQGEFMQKIEKNPQALQKLQNDPKLLKAAEQNPKIILDLLEGKEVALPAEKPHPATQGQLISPINKNRISGSSTNMTKAPAVNTTNKTGNSQSVDSATYIPSSAFSAPSYYISPEQQTKYTEMMNRSDKILQKAEQYI